MSQVCQQVRFSRSQFDVKVMVSIHEAIFCLNARIKVELNVNMTTVMLFEETYVFVKNNFLVLF